MNSQILGICALATFYLLFFVVGGIVARRQPNPTSKEFLLAGRRLPVWIGVLTMTATWVGGGYLNGTAEAVGDPVRGLVWAQAPWGYALSLIVGGIFFAARMRRYGFRTMLDLFHFRYGKRIAAILFLPALMGELFWSAAILVALGTTFGTILGFSFSTSILISAAVAVSYTFLGGLRSVAYTDTLQILFIVVGLGVALPFVLNYSGGFSQVTAGYWSRFGETASLLPPGTAWTGAAPWGWQWTDSALLLVFGGIPWQVYFQRVLACNSPRASVRLSIAAGFGCLIIAVPAVLIGMAGSTFDWSQLPSGGPSHPALILPWVLRYLTPPLIAVIGLTAVAAAVMSSVDSSILSASTLFSWNVYRPLLQREENDARTRKVAQLAIIVFGISATMLALSVQSVYTLWFLCADLVYVILFPQLVMALFYKRSNALGVIAGLGTGLILRLGGGEPTLGLPAFIPYPWGGSDQGLLFPFRTFAMLGSLLAIWVVSSVTSTRPEGKNTEQRV